MPLVNVTLPNSIKTIGREAFAFTNELENIVLPVNLEVIGQSAFEGSGLETLVIPFNVKDIQERAFASSTSLRKVKLEPTSSRTKIDIPANA